MARIRNRPTDHNGNTTTSNSSNNSNSYEEARKQRLQQNLQRFQDFGILKLSQSLSEARNLEKKSEVSDVKPKSKTNLENVELRRSSRERGVVPSYQEVDVDFRGFLKRFNSKTNARRSSSAGRNFLGRLASYEERQQAIKGAEELQSNLNSGHPSFVKSMVRSHVSSCFWLGLPSKFCKENLPPGDLRMVLEDQNGSECDALYIGSRTGLSGGWRGFAMDHGLDDGDALLFELSEPARFKIYIVKVSNLSNHDSKKVYEHVAVIGNRILSHKASGYMYPTFPILSTCKRELKFTFIIQKNKDNPKISHLKNVFLKIELIRFNKRISFAESSTFEFSRLVPTKWSMEESTLTGHHLDCCFDNHSSMS